MKREFGFIAMAALALAACARAAEINEKSAGAAKLSARIVWACGSASRPCRPPGETHAAVPSFWGNPPCRGQCSPITVARHRRTSL